MVFHMRDRSKKAVSVLLASCLTASILTGCDLPFGKKKAQQAVVEDYIGACLEFDYHAAAALVQDKDDAFQDVSLESPQRDICEMVLSKAEFEVVKVDNDRALVNFTAPDVDRALKRENIAALELEDVEDILEDTYKLLEEEFEFDLVKDGKEWLIDPDSTEDFAEFISEIGLDAAPELGLGTRALEKFNTIISLMAEGNVAAADALMYHDGYSGTYDLSYVFGDDAEDIITSYYAALYSSVDYEAEIISCDSSSVTLEITGTRLDLNESMSDIAANNAVITVPYVKALILFYISISEFDYSSGLNDLDYSGYLEAAVQFYIDCLEAADPKPFTLTVVVEIDETGEPLICEDDIDIIENVNTPDFAEEFYYQALDELLADGEITQEQYDELYGQSASYLLF